MASAASDFRVTISLPRLLGLLLVLSALSLPFVVKDTAWAAGEHCMQKPYRERVDCYAPVLEDVLRRDGTPQALKTLRQLATADEAAQKFAHPLTHHIGRLTYAQDKNVAKAFLRCTDDFHNGCYHGVLEAHLSGMPHLTPRDVGEVCLGVKDPLRPDFTHAICTHGLGHGLMMYFQNDMFKALAYCDGLTGPSDQESCYGGVYMQNIVEFTSQSIGAQHSHAGHNGHAGRTEPRKFLDPNDQLYPCTAVAKKYQGACYLIQASAILALNGHNFAQTFMRCQQVPTEYLNICIQSVGREVSAFTLADPETTKAICSLATPPLIGECLRGAAKDFIYAYADPQRGIALCRIADKANKDDCYKGVGEVLISFYPDREQRREACQSAELTHRATCRGAKWWLFWLN